MTAATDFAQVERLTPSGLIRESLLFFMDLGTREVRLGGIVNYPDGNWTTQIARNMCDMWDGFMLGKKYLIHDRDTLFHRRFDMIFESIGVKIKKLPPFSPQMNSRMENFIRAIRTECLDKMIFTSQGQLRIAVWEYLEYWNHYRPHDGLGGNTVSAGHGRPGPGGVVPRRPASRIPTGKACRVRRKNFCNPVMRARGNPAFELVFLIFQRSGFR